MMRRARLALVVAVPGLFGLLFAALPAAPARADHEHDPPADAAAAKIQRTPRPLDAKLYIISPKNGETVTSPVKVRFGLTGMGVAPAGVGTEATGHHHLIIDAPLPPLDQPLPKDAKHVHFGGGQTETTIELPPGDHTLQMVLGDKDHVPHDPPLVSEQIKIRVQ
jgi:Domain of unknown function (DUF4399)